MTADDDIDRLYGVDPADFTALRTELAAAAKKRGDADAAKQIAAARRPTTAAWVVNVLVRRDVDTRDRLADVAEGLRAAHATMDGARIRELSSAQRRLVDELVRAGFAAAGLTRPSAALRDDVMGTLQAAVADPDVAARLGRLAKAERWSGFGDFGVVTTVGAVPTSKPKPPEEPVDSAPSEGVVAAARETVATARRDAEAAERAHADAVAALDERASALASARRRYEKLLTMLHAAEEEMNTADATRSDAEQAALAASDRLGAATSAAALAEAELAALVEQAAP